MHEFMVEQGFTISSTQSDSFGDDFHSSSNSLYLVGKIDFFLIVRRIRCCRITAAMKRVGAMV